LPKLRKLKLEDTVDQKPIRPDLTVVCRPEVPTLKLKLSRFEPKLSFCLSKSKLTMLKHTKTSVKKMNRNVNGLKTYIIKKKKKNSFGSLL
jgi:hypothetical protein